MYLPVVIVLYLPMWFILFPQTEEGEDDVKKGTQLLEVYALEIQMYTAQKNKKKLKVSLKQQTHNIHVTIACVV